MEDDNLYKDLENRIEKENEIYAEKMLIRLIDEGYSKEIVKMFPPSRKITLLKYFSYLFFILSVISYFFTHSVLFSIATVVVGILCYWLSGLLRGAHLKKKVLSNEENFRKFQDLFKRLYE
jgi:hypothetical protein